MSKDGNLALYFQFISLNVIDFGERERKTKIGIDNHRLVLKQRVIGHSDSFELTARA